MKRKHGEKVHLNRASRPSPKTEHRYATLPVAMLCLLFTLGFSQESESGITMEDAISRIKPYSGEHNPGVDTTTLESKIMCGYQGWFAAEGDGANRGWFHYAERHEILKPGHCTFDLWPDMSELDDDEKFATPFRHKDGSTAYLYSPYRRKTTMRHFKWMRDYGIDGVCTITRDCAWYHYKKPVLTHNFVLASSRAEHAPDRC